MGNKYSVIFDKDCLSVESYGSVCCDRFQILIDEDHKAYLKLFFSNTSKKPIKKISFDVNLYNAFNEMIGLESDVEVVLNQKSPVAVFSNEELIPINNMVRMVSAVIKNVETIELEEKEEEVKEVKEKEKQLIEKKPVIDVPIDNNVEDVIEAFNLDLADTNQIASQEENSILLINENPDVYCDGESKKVEKKDAVFKNRDSIMKKDVEVFAKGDKKKKLKEGLIIALSFIFVAIMIAIFILVPKKTISENTINNSENPFDEQLEYFEYHTNESQIIIEKYKTIPEDGVVVIPDGVTVIQNNAFNNCNELSSIVISDTVTSIESGAFSNCSNLESVQLSNKISIINSYTFSNCIKLNEIIIPQSVNVIESGAFEGCTSLEIVNVGESLNRICSKAFNNCIRLHTFNIPNSVSEIMEYAFYGCRSLNDIKIPSSLMTIGNNVFNGCASLEEITIPSSIAKIEDSAFRACNNLKTINYLGSVECWDAINICGGNECLTNATIKCNDIRDADKLIYKLNNTKDGYIVTGVKAEYINITSIQMPMMYNDLIVSQIGDYAFQRCESLMNIVLTDAIISIGDSAFDNCNNLTRITIPSSVTSIGDESFYNCDNLTSVTIDNGVTSIGDSAFDNCNNLEFNEYDNAYYLGNIANPYLVLIKAKNTSITTCEISNQCKLICNKAFYNCNNLSSVTICNCVTSIGKECFYMCEHLYSIINKSTLDLKIGSTDYGKVAYYAKEIVNDASEISYFNINGLIIHNNELIDYIGNANQIVIPDTITSIGDKAFSSCSRITSIVIPDSVISISKYAFSGCNNLQYNEYDKSYYLGNDSNPYLALISAKDSSITTCEISNQCKLIGSYAFADCDVLTSIVIPDSVSSVGEYTFYNCSDLISVTIENSVTSIGDSTFDNCNNLINVYYFGSLEQWNNINIGTDNECLTNAVIKYNNSVDENKLNYTINSTSDGYVVTGLKDEYKDSTTLTIPMIHNGLFVTSIGEYAFWSCSDLTSVTIGEGVTSIGDRAFMHCSGLKSVTIGNSVTSIENNAFYWCYNLSSVTIPRSVTSIGKDAFFCLMKINVEEGNSVYRSDGNCLIETNTKTLILGSNNSIIPTDGSVTNIGEYAFLDCIYLSTIVIPDSITSIGDNAFYGCSGLVRVTIENGITNIGDNAFHGCDKLVSIINHSTLSINIGDTLNGEIAYNAKEVINNTNDSKLLLFYPYYIFRDSYEESLISYIGTESIINIPYGMFTSIGNDAFLRCNSLKTITIPSSVTNIGSNAFGYCEGLTRITIPSSVISISKYAFSGCNNLQYNEYGNAYYLGNDSNPYLALISAKDSSITTCEISNQCKLIGSYAFADCDVLTSIVIPDSVTSIGDDAFYGCSGLTSVTIGNSVTSIEDKTFYGCYNLTSVIIPINVTSIGAEAFFGCTTSTKIYYLGIQSQWENIKVATNNELTNETLYYYSELQPIETGNYWHYDQDGTTPIAW